MRIQAQFLKIKLNTYQMEAKTKLNAYQMEFEFFKNLSSIQNLKLINSS